MQATIVANRQDSDEKMKKLMTIIKNMIDYIQISNSSPGKKD